MRATFKLTIHELESMIEKLKRVFEENTEIEIRINQRAGETDYLLSSKRNKESLLKSLSQYHKKEFVVKEFSELEK